MVQLYYKHGSLNPIDSSSQSWYDYMRAELADLALWTTGSLARGWFGMALDYLAPYLYPMLRHLHEDYREIIYRCAMKALTANAHERDVLYELSTANIEAETTLLTTGHLYTVS
jgi:hypothetical protein